MTNDFAQQMLIEHQTLKHVMEALRTVLNWHPPEAGMPRKLNSLRFITGSLQRHLQHMLSLEEEDGYMTHIVASNPQLAPQVDALRRQHDEFRESVQQIVAGLEKTPTSGPQQISADCECLVVLLEKLDKHSLEEIDLVQEAFLRDEGGEG